MSGLPPGINLADNDQNAIIGSVSATWALAVITILLRFTCRRISRAGFWWDDWLMVPAFVRLALPRFHHLSIHQSRQTN